MPANVTFRFTDRDFQTASPGVYAILCSCKGTQAESAYAESAQESTLRGFRREVSPDLLRQTEMKSKAGAQCGSTPRDPPENGQAGRAKQQRCCAQRRKFLCSGQKPFVQPSPLRGRCRRSRRMRCSAPARLCRQMLHFASLTEIFRLRRLRFTPFFACAKNGFAKKAHSGDCAAK